MLDLAVPPADGPFEVGLAKKTGLDGLLFHLLKENKPLDQGPDELASAGLSEFECQARWSYEIHDAYPYGIPVVPGRAGGGSFYLV